MKERFRSSVLAAALAAAFAGCASAPKPAPEPVALEPAAAAEAVSTESVEPTSSETQVAAPVQSSEPAEAAEPLALKPDHPERYVVSKGDTLWGIASRFLEDPWRWPELWQKNPQLQNPHRIYPGDALTLTYVDGRPALQVQRTDVLRPVPDTAPAPSAVPAPIPGVDAEEVAALPITKLSPRVRDEALERAIPTIPVDVINPFLSRPRVVTPEELESAPYIVSSVDEHLIAGSGFRVYVRGIDKVETLDYVVVRAGQAYVNPDDPDDVLGHEAIYISDAQLQQSGDPATAVLLRSKREALVGDRLLPADDGFADQSFLPRAPSATLEGRIIGVHGGVAQIGQYQVVVIDKGLQEDLEPGHVLTVYQAVGTARDPIAKEVVSLPQERAGTIMVFRVFDRLSYALVMEATRPMHLNDVVTNPD